LNSTVYFYNNTNSYGSLATEYSWDFGDGSPLSNDVSPAHTYPLAGTYRVILKATDPFTSCNSADTLNITVKNVNTAFGFTTSYVTGSCPPVLVRFNNTSINYTRVAWDFGDGFTADNLNNPTHVYEKPGKYIVTLSVYAPNGIADQHIDSVFVRAPQASLEVHPTEVCRGSAVGFSAHASSASLFVWDAGDGSTGISTEEKFTHEYLSAGTYQANLLIQDEDGCYAKADAGVTVTVRPDPVIGLTPEDPVACLGTPIALHASGGKDYQWSPATGLSNDRIADPLASPTASTRYRLQVIDEFGCSSTRDISITVIQPGSIRVNADTAVCMGQPVPLKAGGEETYAWIGNTEGLSGTQIPDPLALPTVTTAYTVTGSDAHHCFSDTATVHIRVMPLPEVNAGPDVEIWSGESTQLNASGSPDVQQWTWQPDKYLSCADCPAPVSTPLESMQYMLTAKNADGCMAFDTVTVKIDCAESHVSIPNIFTPNHDGVNDVFMIKGIAEIRHLVIYGRWGEKVFERSNFLAGDRAACWDGTFRGMESPSGTYVYFVEMECPAGGLFTRKGSVVLVR
jgi:gliding motility-associated-like protein